MEFALWHIIRQNRTNGNPFGVSGNALLDIHEMKTWPKAFESDCEIESQ